MMNEKLLRFYYKIETRKYQYLMARWRRLLKFYLDGESCRILSAIEKYRNPMYSKIFCDEISKSMEVPPRFGIIGLEDITERIALFGEGQRYDYCASLLDYSRHPHVIVGKDESLLSESDAIMLVLDENDDTNYKDYIIKKYKNRKILYKNGSNPNGIWIGICGNQYFDVFEPRDNEIVVDAGAFDGVTEAQLYDWGGDHVRKVYAFEMDPANGEQCLELYRKNGLDKVVFINKGTSNKVETIHLDDNSAGGRGSTSGNGTTVAEMTTIDSEVGDDKVTFIKMDVEGAELASLQGAARTIKRNKPRLAICIYHKDFDSYELARYLHKLVASYRFRVRHYSSVFWETVLYAEVIDTAQGKKQQYRNL